MIRRTRLGTEHATSLSPRAQRIVALAALFAIAAIATIPGIAIYFGG